MLTKELPASSFVRQGVGSKTQRTPAKQACPPSGFLQQSQLPNPHRRPQWLMCGRCMDAHYPAMTHSTPRSQCTQVLVWHNTNTPHRTTTLTVRKPTTTDRKNINPTDAKGDCDKGEHCHKATTAVAACKAATSLVGLKQCAHGQALHINSSTRQRSAVNARSKTATQHANPHTHCQTSPPPALHRPPCQPNPPAVLSAPPGALH